MRAACAGTFRALAETLDDASSTVQHALCSIVAWAQPEGQHRSRFEVFAEIQ